VRGQILERNSGLDAVFGIAFIRIVNIVTKDASPAMFLPFTHRFVPFRIILTPAGTFYLQ
jgi:hypothetical protein